MMFSSRKYLCCTSCKTKFYYTSIELAFYNSKDETPAPTCRICRKYGGPEVFDSILNEKRVANAGR